MSLTLSDSVATVSSTDMQEVLKGRRKLTAAENRARLAIQKLAKKNPHMNPTHVEVANELGVQQWAATVAIHGLVDKGWAINPSSEKRSLQLVE